MDSRVEQLISAGRFIEAAQWLAGKTTEAQSDRIHRAQLELELGDLCRAKELAEALLTERLDGAARATCLATLGRALGRLGFVNEGLTALRRAIDAAGPKNNFLEAKLRGQFVIATFNWIGIEPVLVELPKLRTAALASGNKSALIDFHLAQGRVAAMQGWLRRADSELRIADQLLTNSPNLVHEARIAELRGIVSLKSCDVASAKKYSAAAIALGKEAGAMAFLAAAFGNLAHLALMTGDYDDGRANISNLINMTDARSRVRLGAYSTAVEIGLASGDSDYAARMVVEGESFEAIDPTAPPYYALWFTLSRARWLICQGRFEEAGRSADAALQPAARFAGFDLLAQLNLVATEAYARSGDVERATHLFRQVTTKQAGVGLETFAEVNRVAAILARLSEDALASQALLSRANRVLCALGLHGSRTGLIRTASQLGIQLDGGSAERSVRPECIMDSAAAILQLGGYASALGGEIMWVLDSLGAIRHAVFKEVSNSETRVLHEIGAVTSSGTGRETRCTMAVGETSDKKYVIDAVLKDSAADAMLWPSLQQIVRTADPSTPENSEIILWPTETPEEQLGMVVISQVMIDLLRTCVKLAPSRIAVLITGETGTGKELLAKALHDASPREKRAFIPFNCTACSREMLDAQLFGYKRGAFTGANEAFPGVIRAAAGGTLFLDEIGELTLDVQPKLLRFLESGEIHPLGEPRPIHVDVRVVAATNADLEKLVADGRFREDLFYRLNVVRLQVPPLRERREEIPPLVQHYLDKSSREAHKTGIRIADETMEYLILYKWPGNVRQLANEVRRMVALAESGAVLMPEHLSNDIASSRRTIPASERWIAPMEFVVRLDQPMSAAIEHVERSMVQYALKMTSGRLEDAAQLLGLSRKGLYLKRQRLHIDDLGSNGDATADDLPSATVQPAPTH